MFDCRTLFAATRAVTLIAILAAIGLVDRAAADVLTTGVVSPTPPVGGGTFAGQLIVGNGTNEESNDILGIVDIDGGTLLQYGSVILGDNEGFFGEVNVSGGTLGGLITQFNISGSGTTTNPVVQVGNEGTGYLSVNSGARMTLTNTNADFSIGLESTGIGTVIITDSQTLLTSPETIVVGQSGIGNLSVLNGAMVRTFNTSRSNYVTIGRNIGSVGTALVDGPQSILSTSSSLRVGESGIGSLTVRNGALVQAVLAGTPINPPIPAMVGIGLNATGSGHITVEGNHSILQLRRDLAVGDLGQGTLTIRDQGLVQITDKTVASATVGTFGRLELDGGTFDGSTPLVGFGTTVNGYMGGDGQVRGSVRFNGTSSLEAGPGDHLRFQNAVSSQGAVTINAGEIQFNSTFTNDAAGGGQPAGRIALENGGTVRFGSTLTNNGVIANAHGVTNIHGAINNVGTIVVSRDTVATFFNPVNNTGTITVLPGGNALFLADLTFTSMAALQLGLGVEELNNGNSQVNSNGVMTLGGTLEISLDGGFDPLVGQSLQLLSAGGGIVGKFDEILLPLVPNDVDVNLVYGPNGLSLVVNSISPGELPGDYNEDGVVDAADYTVWRNNLGSTSALPNDDTPGVGDDDYTRWKTHFGEEVIVGSGGISVLSNAAPEPSSSLLMIAAIATCWAFARHKTACL